MHIFWSLYVLYAIIFVSKRFLKYSIRVKIASEFSYSIANLV